MKQNCVRKTAQLARTLVSGPSECRVSVSWLSLFVFMEVNVGCGPSVLLD